ncbi:MAG: hypothetical protein JST86_13470 [Bacteroidetes bacterium]|nr:hypothetical protein [Bacteroidota bacterium]
MKRIAVLALLLLPFVTIKAQTDYKKRIVDSTCSCLNQIPDLDKKSQDELQALIGQCMMEKSLDDFMTLAKERNIEMTDIDAMQKLGAEIGIDLVKSDCKAMQAIVKRMADNQLGQMNNGKNDVKIDVATKPDTKVTKGVVQSVVMGDFVYVTVLSGTKLVELVWSDYVDNGNDYAKNLASLKSKEIEFNYVEKEVYSIKSKAYKTVKMITSLSK